MPEGWIEEELVYPIQASADYVHHKVEKFSLTFILLTLLIHNQFEKSIISEIKV